MSKSYKYRRSRKALTLEEATLRMTDAIKAVEKIIMTNDNDNQRIQAAYALSNLIGQYVKLVEQTELKNRIEVLEDDYEQLPA